MQRFVENTSGRISGFGPLMLALKHTNREEIQDLSRDLFERYKDYLLGDYVWGLSSTDLQGNQIQTPPWSLVLSYEQGIWHTV